MSKHRPPVPVCYAMVFPGLEEIAAAEIKERLGAEMKRSSHGVVVFRVPEITPNVLRLRTTEDVYLLAWGTDQLSYRAEDLQHIRRWTAHQADWQNLLQIHHALTPRPRGKPSFHLVTQMTGKHAYRRVDARKALAEGLAGKLPASWRYVDEDASVEVWLTIHGATAVCGLRLSDASMRHRTYKMEHLPASLRPTIAAAMVRLAEARPTQTVLDPMCGAGTLLAELMQAPWKSSEGKARAWGGDIDRQALRAAASNLRDLGHVSLSLWDATRLPLAEGCVDRIISNPPFGKQLSTPAEVGPLYRRMLAEYDRVLRPDGRAVLLVADTEALNAAALAVDWKRTKGYRVLVLGQMAGLSVWRKTTGVGQ